MHAHATESIQGFDSLVNVCSFCYNALQGLNLEGRHDYRGDDGRL